MKAIKNQCKLAASFSAFFFCMYAMYAYGFFFAGLLISDEVYNDVKGEVYTSGNAIASFFGIIFGVMALGMTSPSMKALSEGKVAGYSAFQIIDRVPKIDVEEQNKQKLTFKGHIEFKDVKFKYPTRDQIVLDGVNLTIEEGKTTALVGSSGSGKSTIVQLIERFYDI